MKIKWKNTLKLKIIYTTQITDINTKCGRQWYRFDCCCCHISIVNCSSLLMCSLFLFESLFKFLFCFIEFDFIQAHCLLAVFLVILILSDSLPTWNRMPYMQNNKRQLCSQALKWWPIVMSYPYHRCLLNTNRFYILNIEISIEKNKWVFLVFFGV